MVIKGKNLKTKVFLVKHYTWNSPPFHCLCVKDLYFHNLCLFPGYRMLHSGLSAMANSLGSSPAAASLIHLRTSSVLGNPPSFSLEKINLPLTFTSYEDDLPIFPVTLVDGTLSRMSLRCSKYRGSYPHPPQYSISTDTPIPAFNDLYLAKFRQQSKYVLFTC